MKNLKKAALLTVCAVALVAVTVIGTVAYFTSTKTVTNTFTVGKVSITLDETKIDTDGVTPLSARTNDGVGNVYKLMPAKSYKKDPVIHVAANSEDSYLFVKVDNQLASVEDSSSTIVSQLLSNGWTLVSGTTNVYTKSYTSQATVKDVPVFTQFKVKASATASDLDSVKNNKVIVYAYAIQKEGLTNAQTAWAQFAN